MQKLLGDRELAGIYPPYAPCLKDECPHPPADRPATPGRVIVMILDKMNYENQLIASYKFSNLHIGGPRRPVFFDTSTTRPELLDLDRNYDVIREELLGEIRCRGNPVWPAPHFLVQ